jgi:hypothetical protein
MSGCDVVVFALAILTTGRRRARRTADRGTGQFAAGQPKIQMTA